MNTAELQNARVFVGNLPWSVTDDELNEHMSQAGSVVSCTVLRDTNGRSRGGAVVEFASISDAQNAIDTLTDVDFAGRPLFLREDREENAPAPRPEVTGSAQSRRVYIGNLSWDVAWQDLKDHMRQAGNVMHVDIPTDSEGVSKGFAIVEYENGRAASRAIREVNNTFLKGEQIYVREDRANRRRRS
jgi:RNA recognition motif-containing protein